MMDWFHGLSSYAFWFLGILGVLAIFIMVAGKFIDNIPDNEE